jgi:hypothetical protein
MGSELDTSRPEHLAWGLLQRAATPRLLYRLAAWWPPVTMARGPFVVRAPGPGVVRLRYRSPAGEDRTACLRQQRWALRVPASCGASRVTLEEAACSARGDAACEYVVTWREEAGLAPAALGGACAAGALVATMPAGGARALWLLVPAIMAAAYALGRWRAARANARASTRSDATFRSLVAQVRAASLRDAGVTMEQEGEMWLLAYEGTTLRLRYSRGLALLAHLVRNPGQEIHVSALDAITPSGGSTAARGRPFLPGGDVPAPGDAGEILDQQARAEYRRRIAELREALEQAEAHHDLGRATAMRAELEQLEDELHAAVAPGGRSRRASADAERLRVAITHRIRNAIAQIARRHARLGAHLTASVSTGYRCIYEPARATVPSESPDRQGERKA